MKCPNSIQRAIAPNVFKVFDYESECQFGEQSLNDTAFCGQCARKNSDTLFTNINAPFTFNQVKLNLKKKNTIETYYLKF